MQKHTAFAGLAAMAYAGFAFVQGYSIAHVERKSLQLVLGSAFAPVLFGLILAFYSGRLSGMEANPRRRNILAALAGLAFAGFVFIETLVMFHIQHTALRMVIAATIAPIFLGIYFAFFSGRLVGKTIVH